MKIDKKHISEISQLSIEEADKWFKDVVKTLTKQQTQIADKILKEINERLTFLMNVGCGLFIIVAIIGNTVRWRESAHPPRLPNWIGLNRCSVCSR